MCGGGVKWVADYRISLMALTWKLVGGGTTKLIYNVWPV